MVLRLAEFAAWWMVTAVIWVLTLTTMTAAELVLAVVGAIPAAITATAARRVLGVEGKLSRPTLRRIRYVPIAIAKETPQLLLTAVTGRWMREPLRQVRLGRASTLDRAVTAFMLSASPASVVVDDHDGTLLIHAISARKSALERSVES